MNQEYKSIAHAKTSLRYHIIFSTKYRKKALTNIHSTVLEAFRYAEKNSSVRIIEMNTDEDHIHLLITFKPALSIEQVVRRLKQLTTHYLWEREESHLREHYWGAKKRLWTGGYFCATIGEASESTIVNYIKNQG